MKKKYFLVFACLYYKYIFAQIIYPDFTMTGGSEEEYLAHTVSQAGDLNGDGYGDIAVYDEGYYDGELFEGRILIFMGSSSGIGSTPSVTCESNFAYADLGWAISSGDVNGDGFDDLLAGAYQELNGYVYIYYGSVDGIDSVPNIKLENSNYHSRMGRSVASGDINGDGYDDVITGASNYANGQAAEGAFYVFYGSADGVSPIYAARRESNQANAIMGNSISAADMNGDGFEDVIVGVKWYDDPSIDEGAAFVYYGSASGIGLTPNVTLENNQSNSYMGTSVSNGGDVNNDGYEDIIVGIPNYDHGESNEGRVYIYYGSATGISSAIYTTVEANYAGAALGATSDAAGDVNNDGYDDIIVGAQWYDDGILGNVDGNAFIYMGSVAGITASTAYKILSSHIDGNEFGWTVSGGGDINADGYDDVLVGGPYCGTIHYEGLFCLYNGKCDSSINFYSDADADGYGNSASTVSSCSLPAGYVTDSSDCDDGDNSVYPSAIEICNGIDDNCNAMVDEGAVLLSTVSASEPTTFCTGENVTLSAPVDASYTYQWKKNSVDIPGATASSFTANNTGQYQVLISNGTCEGISDSIAVVKNPKPNPSINNLDATNDLCFDTSIKLKTATGTGYSYQWYKGAALLTGATTNVYFATLAGNYKVKVTNSFGCSKTSAAYSIIKTCKLAKPEIIHAVSVYPNPGNGNFTIELESNLSEDISITIFNLLGEIIYHEKADNADHMYAVHMDNSVSAGPYLLQINTADQIFSEQIVIIR